MTNNVELTALREELMRSNNKLKEAITARNNLESAFSRLLMAVDKQNEVVGPIIAAFKGKDGKKMGVGALPGIIQKVMTMMDEKKTKIIFDATDEHIHPMLTQYVPYYKAKQEKDN